MGPKNISGKGERNVGSDCFAFIQWMSEHDGTDHKISWREAVEILAKRAGIPMETDQYDKAYQLLHKIAMKRHEALSDDNEALEYLWSRGLTDETIVKWKLGVTQKNEFGHDIKRISFPLLTKYDRVVGQSCRAIKWEHDSKFPKYWNSSNSEIFHKRSYLYGMHNYDSNFPELRITEGTMDVITADQFGVMNPVCSLGTAFTREHAMIIKNMGVSVCFCMDGDEAGLKGMRRAVDILKEFGVYAKVFIIPDNMDLAEFSLKMKEKTEEYIQEHSMMCWEFELQAAMKTFSSQLTALRAKAMPDIINASKCITSQEDKILMKSFVKEKFGIEL